MGSARTVRRNVQGRNAEMMGAEGVAVNALSVVHAVPRVNVCACLIVRAKSAGTMGAEGFVAPVPVENSVQLKTHAPHAWPT